MWSNTSAPKSHLKSAQVGQQQQQQTASGQLSPLNKLTHQNGVNVNESSPVMRYKHAVCASSSSNFIYIHGGRFGQGLQLDDDIWRFDPHENSWLQLQTRGCKPPGLQEHSLVEHENCLYLFGGQVSAASGQENSFWRLELATNEWTSLNLRSSVRYGAYLRPTNRRGHSAAIYKHSMYIFGGYEDFRGSSSQLWQYDLLNERWELRNLSSSSACHPEPRHGHSAVVYQDSMYVYGGLSNLKPLGDLWRWSWRDKRWFKERTRGQSPGQLHGHSAVQAFGSMFVFGGERHNGRPTRSLWRLNLANLCWQKIRPKGPRPNPTTWHVAVANPMDVLDEANYLIEGEPAGESTMTAAPPAPPHIYSDDQLVARGGGGGRGGRGRAPIAAPNSLSDNCFVRRDARHQTIPMETIRPNQEEEEEEEDDDDDDDGHKSSAIKMEANHGEEENVRLRPRTSASDQQLATRKRDPIALVGQAAAAAAVGVTSNGKMKRRLRLNFLRPRASDGVRQKMVGARTRAAMEFVRRRVPSSWSAANLSSSGQAAAANGGHLEVNARTHNNQRHSVQLIAAGENESTIEANHHHHHHHQRYPACNGERLDEDVEMAAAPPPRNSRILDNLDTDIKQMFQSAMDNDHDITGDTNLNHHDDHHHQTTPSSRSIVRDSLTQSQLSAYTSHTTTGATNSQLTTQTYQTAREQLTSQSTLTITNQPFVEVERRSTAAALTAIKPKVEPAAAAAAAPAVSTGRLAEMRQRRSMHQFSKRPGGPAGGERRARPKSEILQSLIDRADARIKHFYTPLFQPQTDQQRFNVAAAAAAVQPAAFNSNDPILGSLQNHRMFERSANRSSGGSGGARAVSLVDRSKRHTIHQTTTHYNLYFGCVGDGEESVESANGPHQRQARDELTSASSTSASTSATKNLNGTINRRNPIATASTSYNSTTAALVGVRDGTDSSSTPRNQSRDTDATSLSSSSLFGGLSRHTVDSTQTLRADTFKQHQRQANGIQDNHLKRDDGDDDELLDDYSNRTFNKGGAAADQEMSSQELDGDEADDDGRGDNTSLSFSVIAEFEEDDMLQYSSPTEPNMDVMVARGGGGRSPSFVSDEYEEEEEADEDLNGHHDDGNDENDDGRDYRHSNHRPFGHADGGAQTGLKQQKSTSSGYDSIRSSPQRQQQAEQEPNGQSNRHTIYASKQQSTLATNTTTTTTSKQYQSTTADSLQALTTQSSGCSLLATPHSPPSKSLGLSSSSPDDTTGSCSRRSDVGGGGGGQANNRSASRQSQSATTKLASRLFGRRRPAKTRYWQLCMFVIGGKQEPSAGSSPGSLTSEPINIWRLYI